MITVVLGQNRFIDCQSLLAYKGFSILRVAADPVRVELATPDGQSTRPNVRVNQSEANPADQVRVIQSPVSFAIFMNWRALAVATLLEPGVVHLSLDLRPVGINIYDDVSGLHIGGNTFVGNVVSHSAVGINLGD